MPEGGRVGGFGGLGARRTVRSSRDGFLRRGLVFEEVEIEVVVAFGHGAFCRFGPDHCNPSSGP